MQQIICIFVALAASTLYIQGANAEVGQGGAMPTIKPLSEFNRNQSAVIKELHDSKLPMYLTRNGSAEIVVMDADAFDREVSYRASAYADEMRVYNSLMRGYRDVMDENVVSATEAEEALLQAKGLA